MRANPSKKPFPQYLGMPSPDSALLPMVVRIALAVIGLAWFGFGSYGTLVMSVPLILTMPRWFSAFVVNVIQQWIVSPGRLPLRVLTIGPLIVRFAPRKMQLRWDVPTNFAAGVGLKQFPQDAPDINAIRERSRRITRVLKMLVCSSLLISTLGFTPLAPWWTTLVGVWVLITSLHVFVQIGILTKHYAEMTDWDLEQFVAMVRLMPKITRDRLFTLSEVEIDDLLRLPVGSSEGLFLRYAAYEALGLKDRHAEAADVLKELIGMADRARRTPIALYPQLIAEIYHESAFLAAGYAGDLDYAIRAMAIAGEPYLNSTSYHKAMTAIWIRFGNRPAAQESFKRAQKSFSFWREPDGINLHDIHLRDLGQVFVSNDLQSLAKPGIRSNCFADMDRPVFGRYCRMADLNRLLARVLPVCLFVGLPILAWAVDTTNPGDVGVAVPLLLPAYALLALAAGIFANQINATAEFNRDGVVIRNLGSSVWMPWKYVTKIQWSRHKKGVRKLIVDRQRYSSEMKIKLLVRKIQIEWYADIWPNKSLEEALATKAPFLLDEPIVHPLDDVAA